MIAFSFLMIFTLSSLGSVDAAGACSQTVTSQNTLAFFNEISSINTLLGSCNVSLPSSVGSLVGSGNILVHVAMNDGTTKDFYVTVSNNKIIGMTAGTTTTSLRYHVYISETSLNKILQSPDKAGAALVAYNNKEIKVVAVGFFNKLKFFFAKFFIPKATSSNSTSAVTGKPANCDDTYLPGHRDYAANKALWDSYSADTDGVCQSQFGKGQPSPCVHGVQLSIDGNPYYLCWYNN